jgi:rhodanese-related sulfurtransferase
MAAFVRQIALMVATGLVVGLAANLAHPRGVDLWSPIYPAPASGSGSCEAGLAEVPRIALEEAAALCGNCNVAFVDARGGATFAQAHIAGAIHLPPQSHPHAESVIADLREKPTVIVYGDNTQCDQAESVAQRLIQNGYADVRILEGGWPAWDGTHQPAVSGACEHCVEGADP